jgi:hypothetical protein
LTYVNDVARFPAHQGPKAAAKLSVRFVMRCNDDQLVRDLDLNVIFVWRLEEAAKLDANAVFVENVRARIKQFLGAISETHLKRACPSCTRSLP